MLCHGCNQPILERAIRAKDFQYHKQCFTCHTCHICISPGQAFALVDDLQLFWLESKAGGVELKH